MKSILKWGIIGIAAVAVLTVIIMPSWAVATLKIALARVMGRISQRDKAVFDANANQMADSAFTTEASKGDKG